MVVISEPMLDEVIEEDEGGSVQASSDEEGEEDDIVDTWTGEWANDCGQTFHEQLLDHITTIRVFSDGLEYQGQFGDWCMLKELECTGAGFFHMARTCLNKERKMNTTMDSALMTWEQGASSVI